MTRDQTRALLLMRRELTGESFNDGTLDAWHAALAAVELEPARAAITRAAREHQRIAVAHITELIPRRQPESPPPEREPGCTCAETICDMHRQRALNDWLPRIRAELTALRANRTEQP